MPPKPNHHTARPSAPASPLAPSSLMELTPDITRMFRIKYETKWETQIQQDLELPYHGTAKMREYSGRLQKIQWSEMDFGKRSIKPRKFYDSIPLSEDDKLEMGTLDLRASEVMGEQRKACARMHDEVILGVMENDEGDGYRTQEDGVYTRTFKAEGIVQTQTDARGNVTTAEQQEKL